MHLVVIFSFAICRFAEITHDINMQQRKKQVLMDNSTFHAEFISPVKTVPYDKIRINTRKHQVNV